MKIKILPSEIYFLFSISEATWMRHALDQLIHHYRPSLEELSEKEQAYWKGTLRNPQASSGTLTTESEFLEIERLEWKDLRLKKVEEWEIAFRNFGNHDEVEFKILKEETDLLLQILNDRRLLLATIHDIEEKEMHHDSEKILLDPKAPFLIEIDFLAYIQSLLLRALEHESTDPS